MRGADELEEIMAAQGDPDRAAAEQRYLKSDLHFHGLTLPLIQRVVREEIPPGAIANRASLRALVQALWAEPVHERRMAAVILLERHAALLTAEDLGLLELLLREARTWAYVDALAANVVGPICDRDPSTGPTLDRWAVDPDFWIRRAALLSHLLRIRAGGSLERFLHYADAMLDEREFFIRKAIGWVLRDAGRRRPAEVVAWLAPRTHRASGVTIREAIKHLPGADAERLMAAYRDRRPAV